MRLKPINLLALDGICPLTEAGVREFQKCEGVTVDGIAGPQTLGALFERATVTRTTAHGGSIVQGGELTVRRGQNNPSPAAVLDVTLCPTNIDPDPF